ncbi:MAG: hypothetical protein WC117_00270 [Sphaerochaetaceae bacterium]
MNLFEQASRKKFRFASVSGPLGIEVLWDLPLQSKNGLDLDTVAKGVNAELSAATETSFVDKVSPAKTELEQKLELVKHIIAVKIEERDNALTEKAKKAERQRLLSALERSQDAELEKLTPEQIQERINALS